MGGNVVINKPLADIGVQASHPYLNGREADRKAKKLAALARLVGVPDTAIRALVTRDVDRLAMHAPATLKALDRYFEAGAAKPGTHAKGNHALVVQYRGTIAQAGAARSAKLTQLDREANSVVVGALAELGGSRARDARQHALQGRLEALKGNVAGVQLQRAQGAAARHDAAAHLEKAARHARTPHDKDTVLLAAREAGRQAGTRDKTR